MMNKYSILLLLCLAMPAAFAQNAGSGIRGAGSVNLAPTSPPPGQGMQPAPVIGGDALPPPTVPTGMIGHANGSIFPVSPERIPLIINLRTDTYSHNTHQYMGKRVVLTFRTDTLNLMQMDLIAGILPLNLNTASANGENNISIDVNESQLEQIQNVLVPATHNSPAPQQTFLFHYLPIARKFCQWAVMLGVVFATIMLAVAAYGMVMSHRGSADKVISTVAGLVVLLMAYTIYSLLISNASNHRSINQTVQTSPLQ